MEIFPGKVVALDRAGSVEVSTVELPRLPGDDRVVFETCLFHDDDYSEVERQYFTREQALAGHQEILSELKAHVAKKQQS